MPSANTLPLAGYRALNFRELKDPGSGNTFAASAKDLVIAQITTAGSEARTLAPAGNHRVGARVRVILADDGGDLTINGADRVPVLADVYDAVEFTVVNDQSVTPNVKAWRLTSDSRGGANATETKSYDLPINAGLQTGGNWLADGRTPLTAASADPDCALIVGTHGTSNPLIRATNALTAASTEDFATITSFVLPDDYVAGSLITLTLTIVEGSECDNPDLEVTAFNRDTPGSDIVASGGDSDISGGATIVVTITGTLVAPGDTIDVRINFELTDTGTLTPIYDLTRAKLSYTGNKRTSYVPTQLF